MQKDQQLLRLCEELKEKQKKEGELRSKLKECEDANEQIIKKVLKNCNRPLQFACLLVVLLANFYALKIYHESEKMSLIPTLLAVNYFLFFIVGFIYAVFSHNSYDIKYNSPSKGYKKKYIKYGYSEDTQSEFKLLRNKINEEVYNVKKEINELKFRINLIEIGEFLKVVKEASIKYIEPLRREAEKSNIQELITQAKKIILSVENGSLTHLQKAIIRPIKKELTQIENLVRFGNLPASENERKSEVREIVPNSVIPEKKAPLNGPIAEKYGLKPITENEGNQKKIHIAKQGVKLSKQHDKKAKEIFSQESSTKAPKPNYKVQPLHKKKEYAELIALGNMGEEYVIKCEKEALLASNYFHLADNIQQVSLERRISYGYDILSFDENGSEVYIEVKTTTESERTPFYMTINEMRKFDTLSNYKIYRIYNFNLTEGRGDIYRIESIDDLNKYFSIAESKFCLKKK